MADDFSLLYPVYMIGRYYAEALQTNPGFSQGYAITSAEGQPAFMVFRKQEMAERMMIAEAIAGHIVAVPSPAAMADIIRRFRSPFTLVLVDPDPATREGRGFPVDQFLVDVERGRPAEWN